MSRGPEGLNNVHGQSPGSPLTKLMHTVDSLENFKWNYGRPGLVAHTLSFLLYQIWCNDLANENNLYLFHFHQQLEQVLLMKHYVPNMCVFRFNVPFTLFSVRSRLCLVKAGSSMLTFILLPHWSIMYQTLGMIPHPVTLYWHWVNQS